MIKLNNEKCIGCGACVSACPTKCLAMENDNEGFFYPVSANDNCIECGLCESVCEAQIQVEPITVLSSYAVKNKNENIRKDSSSGGAFFELAKVVIQEGGVVFGAAFDSEWNVCHIQCDKLSDLEKLRKSKYLQSNTNGVYQKVKELLQENKTVLFSGTPCQCNALSVFLGRRYENLFMIDFICHGVPSPAAWQKYLKYETGGKDVALVNFRDKSRGWRNFRLNITCSDSTNINMPYSQSAYMQLFLGDFILRPSCYVCQSKFPNKAADITIGDLWGADKIVADDDDMGITLVIINTPCGKRLFEKVASAFEVENVDYNEAFKYNPNALESAKIPKNRRKVFKNIFSENRDFNKIAKKFCDKKPILVRIKSVLKVIYRKVLK